jgi:DNA-directed RNA polymerase subunit RPC12/RpoP
VDKDKYYSRLTAYILLLLVLIFIGAIILAFLHMSLSYLAWAILIAIALYLLVQWHAKNTLYKCPSCGKAFKISTLIDFISPHYPNKKWLKCPGCGRRSWIPEQ